MRSLPRRFRHESADGLVAEWELRIGEQAFAVRVADHRCTVEEGPSDAPLVTVTAEPSVWLAIDEGALSGGQAFLDRRLGIAGNLDLAVRLQTLFRPYRRSFRHGSLEQVEVTAGDIDLSCYLMGRGRPLVMLHGLGATKVSLFPLMSELAEGHRLIVPDLPGHGASGKPRRADYSPRFYARVIRQLIDELGVEEAVVLGNSLGGRIALELALRSPGRVSAIVLLAPSIPGLRWRYIMGFTKVFPSELGAVPFPLRERWMRAMLRRLFARPDVLSDEAFTLGANEFIRVHRDPAARVAFLASLRHIVTERPEPFFGSTRRIKQPALVLFGDHDRVVPPRLGVRLAGHLPNATLTKLPGVGHVPQLEATRATLDAVKAFLASASAGGAGI
jgi:pimeloyl-ACP methyl ester carboxylesterase